jgi:hypothetical protein
MIQRGNGLDFAREAIAEALDGDFNRNVAPHARIVGSRGC